MIYEIVAYSGTCFVIFMLISNMGTKKYDTSRFHFANACTFGGWASVWSQRQNHPHVMSIIFLILGAVISFLIVKNLVQIQKLYVKKEEAQETNTQS